MSRLAGALPPAAGPVQRSGFPMRSLNGELINGRQVVCCRDVRSRPGVQSPYGLYIMLELDQDSIAEPAIKLAVCLNERGQILPGRPRSF